MAHGQFHTDRLRFRLLDVADIDDLMALDADPAVMRYLNGGRPTSREASEDRVRRAWSWTWAARQSRDGAFVGWFSLRPTGPVEREIGYRLGRAFWGRGLASEGAIALVDLAFERLGAERVWGQTMTVNARSRRVMDNAGLVYARTFFTDWPEVIPGAEQGDVEYEISRQAWLRRRQRFGSPGGSEL